MKTHTDHYAMRGELTPAVLTNHHDSYDHD